MSALREVERAMGGSFGCAAGATAGATASSLPLLLSVRSGAAVSMPGMMDTVLNLGMTEEVASALGRLTGNGRWAQDCHRRFVQMYADVVCGVDHALFEEELKRAKARAGVAFDSELSEKELAGLVGAFKGIFSSATGRAFPEDPREQLREAIAAVIRSWETPRAVAYRRINRIHGLAGTAVNVQAMVFGNWGEDSGTGVLFTRNPATGADELFGEFLTNAQGEDVVAGIRTPQPIATLAERMPAVHAELLRAAKAVERHYRNVQDMEFTVMRGRLWLLQTRAGKRTGAAAMRIAVDMVAEGLVTEDEAVSRLVEPGHVDQLLHPQLDAEDAAAARTRAAEWRALWDRGEDAPESPASPSASPTPTSPSLTPALPGARLLGRGMAASPGAAVGQAVFDAEEAERWAREGRRVVLFREETSPEDVAGMHAAEGIVTCTGGMTSHAAVVARGWGKPCISGWAAMRIAPARARFTVTEARTVVRRGDWVSIDGATGEVFVGRLRLRAPEVGPAFAKVLAWATAVTTRRGFHVMANADSAADAARAVQLGADGIGLCRSEHMWFSDARLLSMRRLILAADDPDQRDAALQELLPAQLEDYTDMLVELRGRPMTVRLLDPPLHEFLPTQPAQQDAMAALLRVPVAAVRATVDRLSEKNPMMGHRGCRLGITFPGLTQVQARALTLAAVAAHAKLSKLSSDDADPAHPAHSSTTTTTTHPPHTTSPLPVEIMVPLTSLATELQQQITLVRDTVRDTLREARQPPLGDPRCPLRLRVGTMIETPRAALIAGELAAMSDFFSFGSNDLTQLTFGFSRDDAAPFIQAYRDMGILKDDPFVHLDTVGVGALIKTAFDKGTAANPHLHVGICGEHGGDPSSIEFCIRAGLHYVSCSPFRIPIARVAAAQALLA